MSNDLQAAIDAAWEGRDAINAQTTGETRDAIEAALDLMDKGEARVAEKIDGEWTVHQWLKKAVLLSFRLSDMAPISGGPGGSTWWDKVPSKFEGMSADDFKAALKRCLEDDSPSAEKMLFALGLSQVFPVPNKTLHFIRRDSPLFLNAPPSPTGRGNQ